MIAMPTVQMWRTNMTEDENPYTRIRRKTANDLILKRCNEAWQEGRQYEKDNPSPETVKRIQSEAVDNFAERVKPLVKQLRYELQTHANTAIGHPPTWSLDTLKKIEALIDNTLKQQKGDEP